jgi:hypothetical protein
VHRYTKNNGRQILGSKIEQNLPMHSEDPEGKECEGSALAIKQIREADSGARFDRLI